MSNEFFRFESETGKAHGIVFELREDFACAVFKIHGAVDTDVEFGGDGGIVQRGDEGQGGIDALPCEGGGNERALSVRSERKDDIVRGQGCHFGHGSDGLSGIDLSGTRVILGGTLGILQRQAHLS